MPIYDENVSSYVYSEIKDIYDNSGTTNIKIGYVYDNNGTTNSLIYSAETQFYPGYTVQGTYDGYSSAQYGSFYANAPNAGWSRAYIAVNLTGINSLKITYTYSMQTYTIIFIGVCTNFDYNPITMNNAGYIKKIVVLKDSQTNSATNATATLNVSDLSGTHYIAVCIYSGSSIECNVSGSISSIIAS